MVLLLAFGVGFGSGVGTIGVLRAPEPARPAPPKPDTLELGAFFGLDRVVALVAPPPPVAPEPAGQVSTAGGLEARIRLAAAPAARPVVDALTTRARIAKEARPHKAVLEYTPPTSEQILVERGDTLMDLLIRAGIRRAEAHAAVSSLREVYDPRRLRAGQQLVITAAAGEPTRRLLELSFDLDFEHELQVTRNAAGTFHTAKVERPQRRQLAYRTGRINSSLYLAAERVAMPPDVLHALIKLFSWDVDFQRDIRPGDGFETLFEQVSLEQDERVVRGGDLIYARLALSGVEIEAYRFVRPDGSVEYFDRSGKSLRKFLLRTPVDGARMSSGFGMRRHPILGYSRMHKGVDFAAPTGTPIYAAGDGRIVEAGRNGGYGNYVRLRHNGEYHTAYAHLSRIAKGVRPGARVKQGQVIGYVGTTGRSTGPHLHYEVLRQGAQINPLKLKHPPTAQLKGDELERFEAEMARIDRMRQDLANGTLVAGNKTAPTGG